MRLNPCTSRRPSFSIAATVPTCPRSPPTVSGTYLAFITRGGVAILGSPYLFTVVPGMISAARSTLECIDGEESVCPLESDVAVVGVEAKFHVVARDAHGNVNTRPADTETDRRRYVLLLRGGRGELRQVAGRKRGWNG
jgi:hypothetical protein